MSKFMNMVELRTKLKVSEKKLRSAVKELGLTPVDKDSRKPTTVKPGKVYKAKDYRRLSKYFKTV